MTNEDIADLLEQIADLYKQQDDEVYRVQAYQDAAQTIRHHDTALTQIFKQSGSDGLEDIHNIGEGIASVIAEYVTNGHSTLLDDLLSKQSPIKLMERIPGIGSELASRIVNQLHIRTLEELENVAHNGQLAQLEGFGERRVQSVRDILAGLLSRNTQDRNRQFAAQHKSKLKLPPVDLLLKLDEEYREKSKKDELKKIAPRRLNPEKEK